MKDPSSPNGSETLPVPIVFWTLRGLKQADCVVTRGPDGFTVCIQRGDERETFLVQRVKTLREVVMLTEIVKQKLLQSGWVLCSDFTEARILELARGSVAAA